MLNRLTTLAPVLPGQTLWSGIYQMIQRFNRIKGELEEIAETEGCDLPFDRSPEFHSNCLKIERQLKEINTILLALQEECLTLNNARFLLDTLVQEVKTQFSMRDALLLGCWLKDSHIKFHSKHSPDPLFESGVTKIQNGEL